VSENRITFLVSAFIFLSSAVYLLSAGDYSDRVEFKFDMVTYQFLGANLALGHGFQIGAVEDPSIYKFVSHSFSHRFYKYIAPRKHAYSFGRAPGYPMFLAAVYKIAGIHPMIAKVAQAFLLSFCASLLPVIGRIYWRAFGVWCGAAAAFLFMALFCPDPSVLMAEPLFLAGLLLWVVAFVRWERRPTVSNAAAVGCATAVALLIKPAALFLPLLFVLWVFVTGRTLKKALTMAIVHIASIAILIAPWSAYATSRNELPGTMRDGAEIVVLSTQGRLVLLDGNNEESIKDGKWHPEWRARYKEDPKFLYNRLDYSGRSSISLVLKFWIENADRLAGLFLKKVASAFYKIQDIAVTLSAFSFYAAFILSRRRRKKAGAPNDASLLGGKAPLFPVFLFLNILGVTLILFGDRRILFPFFFFWLIPAIFLPLCGIQALAGYLRKKGRFKKGNFVSSNHS
jgi:hypothetical protein